MSPISRQHCMSIQHGEGSDICFFCQKLPTSANKTTTNLMPPKKKKGKDVVTATAAAANAAAGPPIKPYFGANWEATAHAASLPPFLGFEAFRAANSATAPPLLSLAGQSTAREANSTCNLVPLLPRCHPEGGPDGLDLSNHFSPQHRQFVERPIQLQHRHRYAKTNY